MLRIRRVCLVAGLLAASLASAEVSVEFSNSTLATNCSVGILKLEFTVDSVGAVFLDATTTSEKQEVIDAVDAWDGSVGTISFAGAFNTQFSLVLQAHDAGGLVLSPVGGGGLGVGGRCPARIDRPGVECVFLRTAINTGKVNFHSVQWSRRFSPSVQMLLAGPFGSLVHDLPSPSGSWDVSELGLILGDSESLSLGNCCSASINNGYSLFGITFDVIADAPHITVGLVPESSPSANTKDGTLFLTTGAAQSAQGARRI